MNSSVFLRDWLVFLFIAEGCSHGAKPEPNALSHRTFAGTYEVTFREGTPETLVQHGRIEISFGASTYTYSATMFDAAGNESKPVSQDGRYHVARDTVNLRDNSEPFDGHHIVPGLHLDANFGIQFKDSSLALRKLKDDGPWKESSWQILLNER